MPVDQTFINSLKNPDPIDWSTYKAPTEGSSWVKPPIPKTKDGKSVVFEGILPPGFNYESKNGELVVIVDPITLKGSDYKVRFTHISGKKFQSSFGDGKDVSYLANFVRSVDKNARPTTAQEYIRLIDSFARRPFKFTGDWEAYDKVSGQTVAKGYANFPLDEKVNDGFTRVPWIDVKTGKKDASGKDETRRVFANLKTKNYIGAK